MDYGGKTSEWHEQVEFSELFFKSGVLCRDAQMVGDLSKWKAALEAKVSLVGGVLDEEEVKKIRLDLLDVHKLWLEYLERKKYSRERGKVMSYEHPAIYKLNERLFEVELQLDTMINKKMPFLNTKKRADINTF